MITTIKRAPVSRASRAALMAMGSATLGGSGPWLGVSLNASLGPSPSPGLILVPIPIPNLHAPRRPQAQRGELRVPRDPAHGARGLGEEGALRRLAAEHGGVRAVEHRLRHVDTLGSRRPRVGCHRLEHLRRGDCGLTRRAREGEHPLRRLEQLLGREFHAEVAPREHDPVHLLENGGVIFQPLLVFNLRDDAHMCAAILPEHAADELHVPHVAHERRRDVIHALCDAEVHDVAHILVRKYR
mmetsp:Transcript_39858/g.124595  ORF Transcript_39858/g.124595 Transcript_39858/m.124595 type:complete len:242 (+) Transcript_39858:465-1190(+)